MKAIAKKCIDKIAAYRGYKLVSNNTFDWPAIDEEFQEIFKLQQGFGGWSIGGPKIQRMYMIRNFLLSLKNKEAAWAECGVYKGSTSLLMAEYATRYKLLHSSKKIHLFDSFAGISEPGTKDHGTSMKKGDYFAIENEVRHNLSQYDLFQFHKGWIPERFSDVKNEQFSFLHVDVDMYQPVFDTLNFFIPLMTKAGVIVLDDYGFAHTPGAMKAADEVAKKYQLEVGKLPFGQAFIIT